MLEEYEKSLDILYGYLDAELSLPLRLRRPERIECIKGMIEDVAYALGCLRPSDKVSYRPRRNTVLSRPALYRADV